MAGSRRGVRLLHLMAIAGIGAGCSDLHPLAPIAPAPRMDAGVPQWIPMGTFPFGTDDPTGGLTAKSSGITIPAGVTARVWVRGGLAVSYNPDYDQFCHTGFPDANGCGGTTYDGVVAGPMGLSDGSLVVSVYIDGPDGRRPVSMGVPSTGDGLTVTTDVPGPGTLGVARSGTGLSYAGVPAYLASGSQVMEVDTFGYLIPGATSGGAGGTGGGTDGTGGGSGAGSDSTGAGACSPSSQRAVLGPSFEVSGTCGPPSGSFNLVCTGDHGVGHVTRGETVRCVITPTRDYQVVRRMATNDSLRIEEAQSTSGAANIPYEWSGKAVTDTRVSVTIRTTENGVASDHTYSASFRVDHRNWPTAHIQTPVRLMDPMFRPPVLPYPSNGVLGASGPDLANQAFERLTISRPADGPNAGLAYIESPLPDASFLITLHPGLYPVPAGIRPGMPGYEVWHQWHDDQNGRGSGTCTQSVFSILTPAAERHEGLTMAPDSHWGVAVKAYEDLHLELRIEEIYSTHPNDLSIRYQAWNAWMHFHSSGGYASRQAAFDASDYPRVNQSLGCLLDMNPADQ